MISSYNDMGGVKDVGFFCLLVFEFFLEFKYTRFVISTVEPFFWHHWTIYHVMWKTLEVQIALQFVCISHV